MCYYLSVSHAVFESVNGYQIDKRNHLIMGGVVCERAQKTVRAHLRTTDKEQHIYIYIYICVCVCVCVYIYICICVCICICIYVIESAVPPPPPCVVAGA